MAKQPPFVNGIMDLTEQEKTDIYAALESIISSFVVTDDQPVADTFYITATYNRSNPSVPINGDTVQMILSLEQPVETTTTTTTTTEQPVETTTTTTQPTGGA